MIAAQAIVVAVIAEEVDAIKYRIRNSDYSYGTHHVIYNNGVNAVNLNERGHNNDYSIFHLKIARGMIGLFKLQFKVQNKCRIEVYTN